MGPDHWKSYAHQFGFEKGKAAHSLWMEMGAELGVPGLACLLGFYLLCIRGLWTLHRRWRRRPLDDPWPARLAGMVICSLVGFVVSAQFVTIESLEIPYYVGLIGACVLKVHGSRRPATALAVAPPNHPAALPGLAPPPPPRPPSRPTLGPAFPAVPVRSPS